MDGVDASTTFTDVSSGGADSPHTVTATANAQVDTAQKLYGTGSVICDQDSTDFLTVNDSVDWYFGGTGDFTIECFVRFDADAVVTDATNNVYFWYQFVGSGEYLRFVYFNALRQLNLTLRYGGTNEVQITTSFTPVADTWYHVVAQREGNYYLTAAKAGRFSYTETIGVAEYNASNWRNLSAVGWVNRQDLGPVWVDEHRISKIARYNYTLPG